MTKARKEAQEQQRQEMQEIVTMHLRTHNARIIEAKQADPPFPEHDIAREKAKLQGKIEAYRALGFRVDVFS